MRVKLLLLIIIFSFCTTISFSQDVEFTGYGAAGIRVFDRLRIIDFHQEAYFEGKFQAEMKINKDIEAQLDFRGNSLDQRVELREFSAKFKYIDKMKIKVGNLKQPFGYERIESREDLFTVNRSFLIETIADLGYGGRSLGILGYYDYSKDEKDYPHSYYIFLFKNNNLQNGATLRYSYFPDDDLPISINYSYLSTGGEEPIQTHAGAAHIKYDKKDFFVDLEVFLFQDPVEGIRRKNASLSGNVLSYGAKASIAVGFDIDGKIIKEIEPFYLVSYYQPDSKVSGFHTIENLAGANFYFDDDVRFRINLDLLLTKNEFNSKYSTHNSQYTFELQVRY